jgi:hypothetical protein
MAQEASYPPLDTPKRVAEEVWVVDSGPQRVLGLRLPVRMTVLRLADGGLWLHSPTRHTPRLAAALTELGPIAHLVAPNTAHWTHLSPWQKAFPEAPLWAAPGVVGRARDQGTELRAAGELPASPPPPWAGEIEQVAFGGPGFSEIAFFHHASRSLVLADLVQAMEASRLPLGTRLLARLVGAASGGDTPAHLRLLLNRRREENRTAAERLLALGPVRVIFAHGAFFAEDGAARLRRALGWLLG